MARLQLKSPGDQQHAVELKFGINRLGRAPGNDVHLEHPSVSGTHCEISLGCGQVSLRDCESTNGTFVDGTPVQSAILFPGQTLRLGEFELLVVDTEIPISIPKFDAPVEAPPIILSGGGTICRRHRMAVATFQCSHCRELLCDECIHRLRRRGGKLLQLCPLCSYPVVAIGQEKKKKKSLFRRFCETTRMILGKSVAKHRT